MSENKTKWEERAEKLEGCGKKMEQLGCLLTGLITLPVLGVLFLGIPGLIIGIIVGIMIAAGAITKEE